jgi:shikimate dehydrogenase
VEWAESLGKEVSAVGLENIGEALTGADLLVNATSVGMSPADNTDLVPAGLLAGVPLVFDIVYNPLETRLLKDAKKAGARTISGLEMLVWQGALAFELWTKHKAPVEIMRHEALRMLGQV